MNNDFSIIAGPCAIESYELLRNTALAIKDDINILRGGAYKPRTKPGSFEGLGEEGLKYLKKVGEEIKKPVVSELLDVRDLYQVKNYVDIIQVGARNMYNYPMLKELGKIDKPVLLKRGLSATVSEWLAAAEYIIRGGNKEVILCERGIRTFENSTRNTLDLAGAYRAKLDSGLKVFIDPSHATGDKELISPMVKASKVAGFDGVMVEVHIDPKKAKCDADQALLPAEFKKIIRSMQI